MTEALKTAYCAVRTSDGDVLVNLKVTREQVIAILSDHVNSKYRDFSFEMQWVKYDTTTQFINIPH